MMEVSVLEIEGKHWELGFSVFTGEHSFFRAHQHAADLLYEHEVHHWPEEVRTEAEELYKEGTIEAFGSLFELAAEDEVYVVIDGGPIVDPDLS